MAFNLDGLALVGNGGVIAQTFPTAGTVSRVWHYVTNDTDTQVETDGYFDSTNLRKGDVVLATIDLDGTPEGKTYLVTVGTGDAASNDVTVAMFATS